ncbi:MAG TPA: hypothetical protein VLH80_07340 [Nitrospiraceae bacterium]|nr:hypothetical protein [Nitrospiraceae bacterium]
MRWLKLFIRSLTQWAWEPELSKGLEALEHYSDARRIAMLEKLRCSMLEELFREKQAKITRLQLAYSARKAPLYEDMRKENPVKDAESLAQSISVMAAKAEAYRARYGRPMKWSDGTVQGVPGDQPNVAVGEGW